MSWETYNEWIETARDAYDLDLDEARDLYRDLGDDLDRSPDLADIFTEEAGLFIEDERDEEESEYELFGPDDDWIEAGEEVEVTADLAYEEGR